MSAKAFDLKKHLILPLLLLATVFYLFFQFFHLAQDARIAVQEFIRAKGDYEALRERILFTRVGEQVKRYLGPEARVQTSFPTAEVRLDAIAFKYDIYPIEVIDEWPLQVNMERIAARGFSRDDWDYFVDFHHAVTRPPAEWKMYPLSDGVRLFAKEGMGVKDFTKPVPPEPVLKIFFIFVILMFYTAFLGRLVLNVFRIHAAEVDQFWFVSTSFLTGLVVSTILVWVYLLFGGRLDVATVSFLWGWAAVILLWWGRLRGREVPAPNSDRPHLPEAKSILPLSLTIAIVTMIVGVTVLLPVNVWDEMLIWLLKSKMFFYKQGLDFHYTANSNNYYPVLWSLNIAIQYVFMGGAFDEVARWTAALVFVCLVGQIKGAVAFLRIGAVSSWLIIAIYLLVFKHWVFYTALTENVYIALVLGMATAVLGYYALPHAQGKKFLFLGLLMALGLSGVKFEGAIVSLFCAFAFFVSAPGWRLKWWAALFCIPLIVPWAWVLWLKHQGVPIFVYHFGHRFLFSNFGIILSMVPRFLATPEGFIPVLLGAVFYFLRGGGHAWSPQEVFLLFLTAGLTGFSLSAGVCWPPNEITLYYPEVLTRLFLRATPFLMLLWSKRLWRSA